jgi:hypothetical protein
MIKAKIIPAMALSVIILASCSLPDFSIKDPNDDLPDTLDEGSFYAQNIANRLFYVVEAEFLCEGEKCVIWVEKSSRKDIVIAPENIAREYDNKIRQRIVDAFSEKDFTDTFNGREYPFADMLDYANWLANGDDGKLTILLLDIKDGYKTSADPYVAGYFYAGNFSKKGKNKIGNSTYCSNGRDMIYVDINPGLKEHATQAYATFAHELQHLVNFVTSYWLEKRSTDVWVNEGLSAYAEHLYLGEHPPDKIDWLSNDRNTVKTGNNFFVWDNHKDNPLAIMDDYATVYLFFRWLYLQAGTGLQSSIFRDITRSRFSDYQAVTEVAARINPAWTHWETLLRTWLAANYNPENTVYGYKGDKYLQYGFNNNRGVRINPIGVSRISLYPGEGVYSIINNPVIPAVSGANIRYAGLVAGNTGGINLSPPYSGNALLTFNANTSNSAGAETGFLTGVTPPRAVSRTAAENAQPKKQTRPFVIDAQDLLGRNQDMPIRVSR